jgi:hypothetical protein
MRNRKHHYCKDDAGKAASLCNVAANGYCPVINHLRNSLQSRTTPRWDEAQKEEARMFDVLERAKRDEPSLPVKVQIRPSFTRSTKPIFPESFPDPRSIDPKTLI